eukprot:gene36616-44419_t
MSALDTKSTSVVVSDESNGALSIDTQVQESIDPTSTPTTPIDRYGFVVNDGSPRSMQVSQKQNDQRKAKEAERTKKWVKMIKNWKKYYTTMQKYEKLKRRCRKGIPDAVRGYAWLHMAGVEEVRRQLAYDAIDTSQVSQTVLDEIERDVDRTYPKHLLFQDGAQGQHALRNLLRRYAALDKE